VEITSAQEYSLVSLPVFRGAVQRPSPCYLFVVLRERQVSPRFLRLVSLSRCQWLEFSEDRRTLSPQQENRHTTDTLLFKRRQSHPPMPKYDVAISKSLGGPMSVEARWTTWPLKLTHSSVHTLGSNNYMAEASNTREFHVWS